MKIDNFLKELKEGSVKVSTTTTSEFLTAVNTSFVNVSASVYTHTTDGHNKYWVLFKQNQHAKSYDWSNYLPWWYVTYYGPVGRKGKTTVKQEEFSYNYSQKLTSSKTGKGYDNVGNFNFRIPVSIVKRMVSTSSHTGQGGVSKEATEVFMQVFFNEYHKLFNSAPPCGSVSKGFLTEGDNLIKAAYAEFLNAEPLDEESYQEDLAFWETWATIATD